MKQYIDQSQYDSLSDEARQKFIEWTLSKGDYAVTYRSIGHLIWFLDEHGDNWRGFEIQRDMTEDDEGVLVKEAWSIDVSYGKHTTQASELVDALWDAVKLVLEGKQS